MSQYLPSGGFEWKTDTSRFTQSFIQKLPYEGDQGYFIEATVSYPDELHNLHDQYPLCPDHKKVSNEDLSQYQIEQARKLGLKYNNGEKLIASLENKENYVFHFW